MKFQRDPFDEFFDLQKQVDRIFDSFLHHSGVTQVRQTTMPEANIWHPPMDVYETVDTFIIKLELAGIQPESDVQVALQRNVLTIRGTRRDRTLTKKEHYHRAEVNYGTFERVITLPNAIDEDATPNAHYENGFLEIRVPKVPPPKPREIPIEVRTTSPAKERIVETQVTPSLESPEKESNSGREES